MMHGQYTTPTPRIPPLGRPVLFALFFALIGMLAIAVALMLSRAMAPPAVEEAAPAVDTQAWEAYRQGEYTAAPPVAAPAVRDEAAFQAYRAGERSPVIPAPAVRDEAAFQAYRAGERSPVIPAPAVRDGAAFQAYRAGERMPDTQEP